MSQKSSKSLHNGLGRSGWRKNWLIALSDYTRHHGLGREGWKSGDQHRILDKASTQHHGLGREGWKNDWSVKTTDPHNGFGRGGM